jgi:DNA polymerase-3 subunit alpha (Gram-positive type)
MSPARFELCAATLYGDDGITEPENLIQCAIARNLGGIALMDRNSAQAFPKAERALQKITAESKTAEFRLLFGCTFDVACESFPLMRWSVLAATQEGLKNLYRLLTLALNKEGHQDDFRTENIAVQHPKILSKEVLYQNRNGLILSISADSLYYCANRFSQKDMIQMIAEADYITLPPYSASAWSPMISEEEWRKNVLKIMDMAERAEVPVCAVSNVLYSSEVEQDAFQIRSATMTDDGSEYWGDNSLRDEKRISDEFRWLNDEQKVNRIVIKNPRAIAHKVQNVCLFPDGYSGPNIFGAQNRLAKLCRKNAIRLFGAHLPRWIEKRMEEELETIHKNGFDSVYLLTAFVVGAGTSAHLYAVNGAEASFVNYLLEATDVNPLPPYYYCSKCRKVRLIKKGEPDKKTYCPKCGGLMHRDGFDIDWRMYMGADGDLVPQPVYESRYSTVSIMTGIADAVGSEKYCNTGKIERQRVLSAQQQIGYYQKIHPENGFQWRLRAKQASETLENDKHHTETGESLVVIPRGKNILDYSPLMTWSKKVHNGIVTCFDYDDLRMHMECIGSSSSLKLDALAIMEAESRYPIGDIHTDDEDTIKLFAEPYVFRKGKGLEAFGPDPLIGVTVPNHVTFHAVTASSKPKDFLDVATVFGICNLPNLYIKQAMSALMNGHHLSEIVCTKEDFMDAMLKSGIRRDESFIELGIGSRRRIIRKEAIRELHMKILENTGIDSNDILLSRADCLHDAKLAYCEAWYKVHCPASYFSGVLNLMPSVVFKGLDFSLTEDEMLRLIRSYTEKIGRTLGSYGATPFYLGIFPNADPTSKLRTEEGGNEQESLRFKDGKCVTQNLDEAFMPIKKQYVFFIRETLRYIYWLLIDAKRRGVKFKVVSSIDKTQGKQSMFYVDESRRNQIIVQKNVDFGR